MIHLLFWIPLGLLIGMVVLMYAILARYIPIIERNAFDMPRHQAPVEYASPKSLSVRNFQIPYDTRSAIQAQYVQAPAVQGVRKLVVFCHETGADMTSWYKHAHFLPKDGIDVLTFNFKPVSLRDDDEDKQPHFQWPTFRDLRCLESVLSWVALEKRGYEVALFGVSKGATVAAAAAATPSPFIRAVMLDGVFSTHLTMQKYMKKWVNIYVSPKQIADFVPDWFYLFLSYCTLVYASIKNKLRFFSLERFAAKLKKPVFLIHGGKDYHVQLDHVEHLRELIPGMTDLWIAERAGHSEAAIKYPSEYRDRIVHFLRRNLG